MISNSTDATRGQCMKQRIEARQSELEAALQQDDLTERTRADVTAALDSLALITTGGLEAMPAMTVAQLSDWLEKHKYLAMNARPRGKQPRQEPRRPQPSRSGENAIPIEIVWESSAPH